MKEILQALYALSQKTIYFCNPEFLTLFVNHLHIAEDTDSFPVTPRQFFTAFIENGDLDLRRICLIRLRAEIATSPSNEEFILWCLPLVISCLSTCSSLTSLAGCILEDIAVVGNASDLVVSTLMMFPDHLSFLLHTAECEELVVRLVGSEIGFELLETQTGWISEQFESFMENGIYDYVTEMDEKVSNGMMQNPNTYAISSFALDGDPALMVNPLRLQPPRHVLMRNIGKDVLQLEWLLQLPLWIEWTNPVNPAVQLDVVVDAITPCLHASGLDGDHSTVRVTGTFVGQYDRSICGTRLQEGGEIRCCLLVGGEGLLYDHLGCDIRGSGMNEFDGFWKGHHKQVLLNMKRNGVSSANGLEEKARNVGD